MLFLEILENSTAHVKGHSREKHSNYKATVALFELLCETYYNNYSS